MTGTYVFLRTNYLVCVALMTPYVLLLFHLLYALDFRSVLSDRVIDTAIGSGIAFIASIFIVPSWEREQITDYMVRILEANAAYFRDVSAAFLGKPVTLTQYKLSRKHAFVALANLSDAFNRILSEPRNKRNQADKMHQFVVSNHMLTSHIATLAYYALPMPGKYSGPIYQPVIKVMLTRMENTIAFLQERSITDEGVTGKEELRILNEKMNVLMDQRKSELERGVMASDTRKQLSGFKPIVDQFNFIAKVTADIEKLSQSLRTPTPQPPEGGVKASLSPKAFLKEKTGLPI